MLTSSNRQNRNMSREVYNTSKVEHVTSGSLLTPDDLFMLPPINKKHNASVNLPPEGFIYGKPTLRYNHSPYEREQPETCLNGAFAWKPHEGSKEREPALDFPKLNILGVKNSVVIPKVISIPRYYNSK